MSTQNMRRGLCIALVVLVWMATTAHAQSTVRFSIQRRGTKVKIVFIDNVPVGNTFLLSFSQDKGRVKSPVVHWWPRPRDKTCSATAGPKQFTQRAFHNTPTADKDVFIAQMPKLQRDVRYCVKVTWGEALPTATVARIRAYVSSTVRAHIGDTACLAEQPSLETSVAKKIKKFFSRPTVPGFVDKPTPDEVSLLSPAPSGTARRTAAAAAAVYHLGAARRTYRNASARCRELQRDVKLKRRVRNNAQARLKSALGSARLRLFDATSLWVGGRFVPAKRLFSGSFDSAELANAIAQLQARRSAIVAGSQADKLLAQWIERLRKLQPGKAGKAPRSPIRWPKAVPQLWTGSAYKTITSLSAAFGESDAVLRTLIAQLRALRRGARLATRLEALRIAVAALKLAEAEQTAAEATTSPAYTAAVTAFDLALGDELEKYNSTVRAVGDANTLVITPSVSSVFSVDFGIAGAYVALKGGKDEVFFAKYVGFNRHFGRVDTDVRLDQQVDQKWDDWFKRHVSLTGGVTIGTPELDGIEIANVYGLGVVPLIGVGLRVSHYMRITLGAMFYRIKSSDPLSSATTFGASPFLSASVDVDVIKFIRAKVKSGE